MDIERKISEFLKKQQEQERAFFIENAVMCSASIIKR